MPFPIRYLYTVHNGTETPTPRDAPSPLKALGVESKNVVMGKHGKKQKKHGKRWKKNRKNMENI